jgi:piezo-type mechanosensitive ion channel component 1/2
LTGQWSKFVAPYGKDKEAMGFLGVYEDIDVAAVRIGTNSSKLWNISPPDRLRFLHHLTEGYEITCRLSYTLHRKSFSKESPAEITETKDIQILKDDPARASLIKLLHNQTDTILHLPFMLPKFLKVSTTTRGYSWNWNDGTNSFKCLR